MPVFFTAGKFRARSLSLWCIVKMGRMTALSTPDGGVRGARCDGDWVSGEEKENKEKQRRNGNCGRVCFWTPFGCSTWSEVGQWRLVCGLDDVETGQRPASSRNAFSGAAWPLVLNRSSEASGSSFSVTFGSPFL